MAEAYTHTHCTHIFTHTAHTHCTHTHTHTHTHTYMQTQTDTYRRTHTHTHTHTPRKLARTDWQKRSGALCTAGIARHIFPEFNFKGILSSASLTARPCGLWRLGRAAEEGGGRGRGRVCMCVCRSCGKASGK